MDIKVRLWHGSYATRKLTILLWILLLAAAGEFVVRGPIRYLQAAGWNDLAQNYAATRLWLRGQDFAEPRNFVELWRDEVGTTLDANTVRTHLAPPLGTLVLMAPIGALPWPVARIVWLAVLVTAFGLTLWSLIRAAGYCFNAPRALAFAACCFALAPFHTGIAAANQTILIVGFCALGIWAAGGKHDVVAGVLFGVACSLKPQIGSFLVLYYLVQRRWRLFAIALGLTAVLVLTAVLWMRICGVSWTHDYVHNVKVLATENKIDDFTSANPIRFMLVNLQVPFYSFTRNAISANIIALATGGLLMVIWTCLTVRATPEKAEPLALATIAIIGLLPVYHRLYDASLLVIPLCWCMSQLTGEMRIVARVALALIAPFLIPGAAFLQQLARNGHIPQSWLSSLWWEGVVMPHQTWLLVLLVIVLLCGLGREPRRTVGPRAAYPARPSKI
jgi:hypothetical protein